MNKSNIIGRIVLMLLILSLNFQIKAQSPCPPTNWQSGNCYKQALNLSTGVNFTASPNVPITVNNGDPFWNVTGNTVPTPVCLQSTGKTNISGNSGVSLMINMLNKPVARGNLILDANCNDEGNPYHFIRYFTICKPCSVIVSGSVTADWYVENGTFGFWGGANCNTGISLAGWNFPCRGASDPLGTTINDLSFASPQLFSTPQLYLQPGTYFLDFKVYNNKRSYSWPGWNLSTSSTPMAFECKAIANSNCTDALLDNIYFGHQNSGCASMSSNLVDYNFSITTSNPNSCILPAVGTINAFDWLNNNFNNPLPSGLVYSVDIFHK